MPLAASGIALISLLLNFHREIHGTLRSIYPRLCAMLLTCHRMIPCLTILRFFVNPEVSFWVTVVVLIMLGVGYIGLRLTKGLIVGYLKADINDTLKGILLLIQGLGSLILALALPNNYLNGFTFFDSLYKESELWIAASIFILLLLFLITFGTFFSWIFRGT
jgi:hypothetical protein